MLPGGACCKVSSDWPGFAPGDGALFFSFPSRLSFRCLHCSDSSISSSGFLFAFGTTTGKPVLYLSKLLVKQTASSALPFLQGIVVGAGLEPAFSGCFPYVLPVGRPAHSAVEPLDAAARP